MTNKISKTISNILGYVFIALFALAIVGFPILAVSQSFQGTKNCAAKHGTSEVVWSYPDKCYVKK